LWGIRTLAEDAAQEALLRIWKGLAGFRGGIDAQHVDLFDHQERQSYRAGRVARSRAGDFDGGTVGAGRRGRARPCRGRRPAQVLDVEAMVGQLRPQYSQVLRLYYMQERSYEEVARMLDLPMGTVKTLLHRAKLELAAQLTGASVKKSMTTGCS
jgi:RNA polymerase sigma-70 factor, ECF subfamily